MNPLKHFGTWVVILLVLVLFWVSLGLTLNATSTDSRKPEICLQLQGDRDCAASSSCVFDRFDYSMWQQRERKYAAWCSSEGDNE